MIMSKNVSGEFKNIGKYLISKKNYYFDTLYNGKIIAKPMRAKWSSEGYYYLSNEWLDLLSTVLGNETGKYDIVANNKLHDHMRWDSKRKVFYSNLSPITYSLNFVQIWGLRKDSYLDEKKWAEMKRKVMSAIPYSDYFKFSVPPKTVVSEEQIQQAKNRMEILKKQWWKKPSEHSYSFIELKWMHDISRKIVKQDGVMACFESHYSTGSYYGNFASWCENVYIPIEGKMTDYFKDIAKIFDSYASVIWGAWDHYEYREEDNCFIYVEQG